MQVMVLEQDQGFQAQLATALVEKGFQVICVESIGAAESFIRLDIVDVLVLGERVGGRLSHSVALLAECRNPAVSAILLTDRTGSDIEEVFELVPAVYAILGRGVATTMVTKVVMAATTGHVSAQVRSRLMSRAAVANAAVAVVAVNNVGSDLLAKAVDIAQVSDAMPAPAVFKAEWAGLWPQDVRADLGQSALSGDRQILAAMPGRCADEVISDPVSGCLTPENGDSGAKMVRTGWRGVVPEATVQTAPDLSGSELARPDQSGSGMAAMDRPAPDKGRIDRSLIQSWLLDGKGPVLNRPLSTLPAFAALGPAPIRDTSDMSERRLHLA